jgi:hypothetical protein
VSRGSSRGFDPTLVAFSAKNRPAGRGLTAALKHAIHASRGARVARRTSRATFPTGVTENFLSSSAFVARLRVAAPPAATAALALSNNAPQVCSAAAPMPPSDLRTPLLAVHGVMARLDSERDSLTLLTPREASKMSQDDS